MAPLAIFGITNDGLNLAVKLLLLFLAAIWLALVFWTFADARRRVADPLLVACATVASLVFPFLGTIVYAIVRPPEFLADVHERELEIAAAEARLHHVEGTHCPHCDFEIEKSFLRCPSCLRRLKEPCNTCGRPLDPRWKISPSGGGGAGRAPAPARQQRRAPARRAASTPGAARPSTSAAQAAPPRQASPARPPQRPSGSKQQP